MQADLSIEATDSAPADILEPLVILSQPRAGTTLLMQLLGTSPQIAFDRIYPFEVRCLTYLLNWVMLLRKDWNPDSSWDQATNYDGAREAVGPFPFKKPHFLDSEDLWLKCFISVWREFSQNVIDRTRENQKTAMPILFYAEKIPYWVLGTLRRAVPYKIILLVRDPRDVFLSITAFDKKRGFLGFGRRLTDDDRKVVERCVVSHKGLFGVMRDEEPHQRSALVKYEQLVVDLDGEAERLGKWLGVKLNASAVRNQETSFAHHMTSTSSQASVGRWKQELTAELNEVFVRELAEEMQHFGYAP